MTRPRPSAPWAVVWAALVFLVAAPAAHATQHLISPGRNWESLDGRVRPGDHVLLLPGVHRSAKFDKLRGTKERPITIRALDPSRETLINAERVGIRLRQPQHVIIQDITIRGATINGITITDEDRRGRTGAPTTNIVVRDVRIEEIGPRGKRNGIQAIGVQDLVIERCEFDGWAGAAIDVVGCRNVEIRECSFSGRPEFTQDSGVMIRAGSIGVRIVKCWFERAGIVAVRVGKKSRSGDFRPPLSDDAPDRTIFEASDVQLRNSLIVDMPCAISLSHASNTIIRSNSFIRPRECFLEVLIEHDDDRLGQTTRLRFSNNLVVWETADLLQLADVDGELDVTTVQLDQNLWWSADPVDKRRRLVETMPGKSVYPQVVDIDPALDEAHNPTTRGTELFGLRAP